MSCTFPGRRGPLGPRHGEALEALLRRLQLGAAHREGPELNCNNSLVDYVIQTMN